MKNLEKNYLIIKKVYDEYFQNLLKSGHLPYRDTEKGIWGITPSDDIFLFFKKINLQNYKNFLDLGSGDGRVVLIASLFGVKAAGIEFDKQLVKDAKEMKNKILKMFKKNKLKINKETTNTIKINQEIIENIKKTKFIQGDYLQHDFSKYNIIFINPDKGFYQGLEDKLLKELKGTLFVFNEIFKPRFLKKGRKIWVQQTPVAPYTGKFKYST